MFCDINKGTKLQPFTCYTLTHFFCVKTPQKFYTYSSGNTRSCPGFSLGRSQLDGGKFPLVSHFQLARSRSPYKSASTIFPSLYLCHYIFRAAPRSYHTTVPQLIMNQKDTDPLVLKPVLALACFFVKCCFRQLSGAMQHRSSVKTHFRYYNSKQRCVRVGDTTRRRQRTLRTRI